MSDNDEEYRDEIVQRPKPLEHVGLESQRVVFADSPMDYLERVLAFRWMEMMEEKEWCVLDQLLYSPPENNCGATQRDAEVAATVIQWLGTAVGYSFLHRCMKEAGFKIEPPR